MRVFMACQARHRLLHMPISIFGGPVAGGGAQATKINGFWFDGTNFPRAQDTGGKNL
jgi:hypothetical protein